MLDLSSALKALDIRRFAATLAFTRRASADGASPDAVVRFPFFHQPIVHAMAKAISRSAAPVPDIAPPWTVIESDAPSGPVRVPPGLVPCAVESGRVAYRVGDQYTVGFTLINRFAPPAEAVVGALAGLGSVAAEEAPFGQLSGNFRIEGIRSLPALVIDDLQRQAKVLEGDGRAAIRMIAPFHGRPATGAARDYMRASTFNAHAWLEAVHWRVFTLMTGRKPVRTQVDDCPPDHDSVTLKTSSLFDVRVQKRRPKPHEPTYELVGLVGRFTLESVPVEWWPWLLLGQHLHAGEGTGWGFGRYRLEVDGGPDVFQPARRLIDRVADRDYLQVAAERLPEAEDIAGARVAMPAGEAVDLTTLADELRTSKYRPAPLNGYEISVHGKVRAIAVATHRDRVVQRATVDVVEPILESLFNDCSVGYRPGRSRMDAARAIARGWDEGFRYALDADIRSFFDRVDWHRLFEKLDAFFPDEPLMPLLRLWISADVLYRGQRIVRAQGLPLGISVSPMLANLFLDDLDDELEEEGFRLVRYADDFVVLTKDLAAAEASRRAAAAELATLGLQLNDEKTQVVGLDQGFSYLGYLFCRSLVIDEGLSGSPTPASRAAPVVKSTWLSQLPAEKTRALTKNGELRALVGPEVVERIALAADQPSNQVQWGLYVVGRAGALSIRYGSIVVIREGQPPVHVPIEGVSHVVVIGSGRVSSPTVLALGDRGIPVFFCKRSGEFIGVFRPEGHQRRQEDYRVWIAQARVAEDEGRRLAFSKGVVASKLARQIETLYRMGSAEQRDRSARIKEIATGVAGAETLDVLRGFEGAGSRVLFEGLQHQLGGITNSWPFVKRQRQPPPDPVNVLLSFGYSLLYVHAATALWAAGLLPQIGVFHALRPGHLALASDLTEEFRHEIDRLVVRVVNRRELREEHFRAAEGSACRLTDDGRRVFIACLDSRLQQSPEPGVDRTLWDRLGRQADRVRGFVSGEGTAYVGEAD